MRHRPINELSMEELDKIQKEFFETQKVMEGIKYDENKPRLDLIPKEVLDAMGSVLAYGAKKYDAHNWRKGMEWHRVYGAALRHLTSFWSGEDIDPESGLPHLHHAAANLAFLITYQAKGIGTDDRSSATVDKR